MNEESLKRGDIEMSKKDYVGKMIESIINTHGANSPTLILDKLLEHYNSDLLIDILRKRVKGDNEKPNSSFIIGIEVYLERYKDDIKLKSAIARIADRYGIKENTVKTHIDKFRGQIKAKLEGLDIYGNYSPSTEDINRFIDELCEIVYKEYWYYDDYECAIVYREPERKEKEYKDIFHNYFIENLDKYFIDGIPF